MPDRIRFGAPQSETTPAKLAQNQYELRDSLSKVAGNHALKFGAELRWEQDNSSLVGGARPLYSFQGLFNLANDAPVFEQINANPATGAPADAQRYFRTHTYCALRAGSMEGAARSHLDASASAGNISPLSPKRRAAISNLVYAAPATLLGAQGRDAGPALPSRPQQLRSPIRLRLQSAAIEQAGRARRLRPLLPACPRRAVRQHARQSALLRPFRSLLRKRRVAVRQ